MSGGRNRADTKYLVAAELQHDRYHTPMMAVIHKATKSPYDKGPEPWTKKDRFTTHVNTTKPEDLLPEHFHSMNKARDILALSDKTVSQLFGSEVVWKGIITLDEYEKRHAALVTAREIMGRRT